MTSYTKIFPTMLLTVLISACGGTDISPGNDTDIDEVVTQIEGSGVKGPVAFGNVSLFEFDASRAGFKGNKIASGTTDSEAKFSELTLLGSVSPPYILEVLAVADSIDLTTGQRPVIDQLITVVTQSMLDDQVSVYASPLTTLAYYLAVQGADINSDGAVNSTEFVQALDLTSSQVVSTLGFGIGAEIDIFLTPPLLENGQSTVEELQRSAQLRTAIEAFSSIVYEIGDASGFSTNAVIEELALDLIDGDINGQVPAITGASRPSAILSDDTLQVLQLDPNSLTIPNAKMNPASGAAYTVGEVEALLINELVDTGAVVESSLLNEQAITAVALPIVRRADIDGDGVLNNVDDFPHDAQRSAAVDADNDGWPADLDPDDNDATIPDIAFVDTDNDGVADNIDDDDDNDGLPDSEEGSADSDADGVIDSLDLDADGDGVLDMFDVAPTDPDVQNEPENSAPIIDQGASIAITIDEDTVSNNLKLTALDDSQSLVWSIEQNAQSGVSAVTFTGDVIYIPQDNFFGSDSFVIRVTDKEGLSDSILVMVEVNPINDLPTINNSLPIIVDMDEDSTPQAFLLTLIASDIETENLSWAMVQQGEVGSASIDSNGVMSYLPQANVDTMDTITVGVSDGVATTVIDVQINISPVNDEPVISQGELMEVSTNEDIEFDGLIISASDVDDTTLQWSIVTPGTLGVAELVAIDGLSAGLSYQPTENVSGIDSITVQAVDAEGAIDSVVVAVTIEAVNDNPVITQGASVQVEMSEDSLPDAFELTLVASDVDSSEFGWDIVSNPSHGVSGVLPSGIVSYQPDDDYFGDDVFTVRVSDGDSGFDAVEVSVLIAPVNDVPVLDTQVETLETPFETPIRLTVFDLIFNDIDSPLSAITITTSAGDNYTGSGDIIIPDAGFSGELTVPVTINDGEADSNSINVTISVGEAPVAEINGIWKLNRTVQQVNQLGSASCHLDVGDEDNYYVNISQDDGELSLTPVSYNGFLTVLVGQVGPVNFSVNGVTSDTGFDNAELETTINISGDFRAGPVNILENGHMTVLEKTFQPVEEDRCEIIYTFQGSYIGELTSNENFNSIYREEQIQQTVNSQSRHSTVRQVAIQNSTIEMWDAHGKMNASPGNFDNDSGAFTVTDTRLVNENGNGVVISLQQGGLFIRDALDPSGPGLIGESLLKREIYFGNIAPEIGSLADEIEIIKTQFYASSVNSQTFSRRSQNTITVGIKHPLLRISEGVGNLALEVIDGGGAGVLCSVNWIDTPESNYKEISYLPYPAYNDEAHQQGDSSEITCAIDAQTLNNGQFVFIRITNSTSTQVLDNFGMVLEITSSATETVEADSVLVNGRNLVVALPQVAGQVSGYFNFEQPLDVSWSELLAEVPDNYFVTLKRVDNGYIENYVEKRVVSTGTNLFVPVEALAGHDAVNLSVKSNYQNTDGIALTRSDSRQIRRGLNGLFDFDVTAGQQGAMQFQLDIETSDGVVSYCSVESVTPGLVCLGATIDYASSTVALELTFNQQAWQLQVEFTDAKQGVIVSAPDIGTVFASGV